MLIAFLILRSFFLSFQLMDEHISFLENLCRLCGKGLSSKADLAHKNSFKLELLVQFEINVENDSEEVHPLWICPACKRLLYRIRGTGGDPHQIETSKRPHSWIEHSEEKCPCIMKARGRPSKNVRGNTTAKNNGSDTESGGECETAQEKNSCLQFNIMFMQNIPLMDRELAHVCAKKLAEQFNFIFLDRENLESSISCLSSRDKMDLTSTIFLLEKENIK